MNRTEKLGLLIFMSGNFSILLTQLNPEVQGELISWILAVAGGIVFLFGEEIDKSMDR